MPRLVEITVCMKYAYNIIMFSFIRVDISHVKKSVVSTRKILLLCYPSHLTLLSLCLYLSTLISSAMIWDMEKSGV